MDAADDKYGWTALMLAVQHKYVAIPHSPFWYGNKSYGLTEFLFQEV